MLIKQALIYGKVFLTIRVIMDSLLMDTLLPQTPIGCFLMPVVILLIGLKKFVGTILTYAGVQILGFSLILQELPVTLAPQKTLY